MAATRTRLHILFACLVLALPLVVSAGARAASTPNTQGKLKLTGTLIQPVGAKPHHGKQKSKTYKLGPVSGSIKAGRVLTLTVKLPVAAVRALARGAKESATFTAMVVGPVGGGRAITRLVTSKATR